MVWNGSEVIFIFIVKTLKLLRSMDQSRAFQFEAEWSFYSGYVEFRNHLCILIIQKWGASFSFSDVGSTRIQFVTQCYESSRYPRYVSHFQSPNSTFLRHIWWCNRHVKSNEIICYFVVTCGTIRNLRYELNFLAIRDKRFGMIFSSHHNHQLEMGFYTDSFLNLMEFFDRKFF